MKLTRYTTLPLLSITDANMDEAGELTTVRCLKNVIENTFDIYQKDWEAAKRTGLLEDKEVFAVERMVKHLKEMLEVE